MEEIVDPSTSKLEATRILPQNKRTCKEICELCKLTSSKHECCTCCKKLRSYSKRMPMKSMVMNKQCFLYCLVPIQFKRKQL